MQIVTLETKVHVVYGIVDDDGDCIQKVPYTFEITKNDLPTFQNLLDHMQKQKEELRQGLESAETRLITENESVSAN